MTTSSHGSAVALRRRCPHDPACPAADASDRDAARVVRAHPQQGWTLLCNGVVVFDDTGELLPDGRVVPPHRPQCPVPRPRDVQADSAVG